MEAGFITHYYLQYMAEGEHLVQGLTESVCIPYESQRVHFTPKNLKSLKGMEEVVRNKIKKAKEGGHISDSHKSLPLPSLHLSPLGIVAKKLKEFILIHHLSYPKGSSVILTFLQ